MLNVAPVDAAVVRCFSDPAVLDGVPPQPQTIPCRVAPDELMLVGPPFVQDDTVARVAESLLRVDKHSVTVAQPDAWSIWVLRGDDNAGAFARLSPICLPQPVAFVQGAVVHVPAKVLALTDALYVMVSSTLGHHLRARIMAACADLNPVEGPPMPMQVPVDLSR